LIPLKPVELYGVPIDGESLIILMRPSRRAFRFGRFSADFRRFQTEFRILRRCFSFSKQIDFYFSNFYRFRLQREVRQVALIDVGAIVFLLAVLGIHFYAK
jgi:hypothetical protein